MFKLKDSEEKEKKTNIREKKEQIDIKNQAPGVTNNGKINTQFYEETISVHALLSVALSVYLSQAHRKNEQKKELRRYQRPTEKRSAQALLQSIMQKERWKKGKEKK